MRNQKPISIVRNEKGIALVMVLILSLIALAVIATLVYLSIQGAKYSGLFKRYETAREAGLGGAEIAAALIRNRGELAIPGLTLTSYTYTGSFLPCDCGDPLDHTDNRPCTDSSCTSLGPRNCLCDKLCSPAYTGAVYNWTSCTDGTTLDPTTNPDIQFDLLSNPLDASSPEYRISGKIIDTTLGNSDLSGEDLGGTGVVTSTAGVIPSPPMPYLYRIEVNSQSSGTVLERSRLSVLYAY